jgi:hypothetical protein
MSATHARRRRACLNHVRALPTSMQWRRHRTPSSSLISTQGHQTAHQRGARCSQGALRSGATLPTRGMLRYKECRLLALHSTHEKNELRNIHARLDACRDCVYGANGCGQSPAWECDEHMPLPNETFTVAAAARMAGYATIHTGKVSDHKLTSDSV